MAAPARPGPQLMTIDEVAQLLRRSVSTLRWWRHRGVGPRGFRVGRRLVYEREDVEAYVALLRDEAGGDARAAA